MAVQILIPLKRHDRVEELMPCFELLAQRGSSVIFLIHANGNLFPWWLEALSIPSTDGDPSMTISVLSASVSLESQLQSAARRLAGVRRALEAKGVVVQVECYGGRLQRELARLRQAGTQTIVLRRKSRTLETWLGLFSFLRRRIAPGEVAAMTLSLPRRSA